MREPTIQQTTALSAGLHLIFFILTIILLKYASGSVVMPSPYTVSLVNPENTLLPGQPAASPRPAGTRAEKMEKPAENTKAKEEAKTKIDTSKRLAQKMVDERISELTSKKKIEHIVKLRSVIAGKSAQTNSLPSAQTNGKGLNKIASGSYIDVVVSKIAQEIVYPDTGEKQLTTGIVVKIMKDGTLQIQKMSQSSGNKLFDNAAIKAIEKASPVPPPPYEMEENFGLHPAGFKE